MSHGKGRDAYSEVLNDSTMWGPGLLLGEADSGHTPDCLVMALDERGSVLATAGSDRLIKLWDFVSEEVMPAYPPS